MIWKFIEVTPDIAGIAIRRQSKMQRNLFDHFHKITKTDYEEILAETGLDMKAKKLELFYMDDNGNIKENPEMVAVARQKDGVYLGTVSKIYGLVQYDEVFQFSTILASDEFNSEYVSGGLIGSGEQAFLAMRTGEHVSLGGGDDIECYFYISTSHNGKSNIDVVAAPLRKVNNTVLRMPDLRGFKFRHSKNVNVHLARAQTGIAKVKNYWQTFEKSFQILRSTRITDKQLDDYLKMVIEGTEDSTRAENMREEIKAIFRNEPTIAGLPSTHGTLLGAYFSVVQYADFESTIRKSNKRDAVAAKLTSLIDGNAAKRKANGYAMALQLNQKLTGVSL